jgi:hypothetical protein
MIVNFHFFIPEVFWMPFQKEPESASYRKTYSESEARIDGRLMKKGDPVFELLDEIKEDTQVSGDEIRKIVAETAERVARELVPEIAERVIREEIEKLKKS